MTDDPTLAHRLLPELPGWLAVPAELTRHPAGDLLRRIYRQGRATASVEVMAGETAAAVVAQTMNIPLGEPGPGGRVWMLRGRKAQLVQGARGRLHSLAVILRGGPGDLRGSVRLEIGGKGLKADDAIGLALALDWDAIVRAMAGTPPPPPPSPAAAPAAASPGPVLWPMLPSLRVMEQAARLEQGRPPRLEIRNRDAVFQALSPVGEERRCVSEEEEARRFAAMPAPQLFIGQRGFAPNLLWSGLHFASARLRDALRLGPDVIAWRDVDMASSAAAAVAAGYRAFHVLRQADPVDLARMYGQEPERDAQGYPTLAWMLSISGPHAEPRRTVWRDGFVPPAPLFRDASGKLIATEALADRLARAGVTDVVFQDVTSEASLRDLLFRPAPGA